MGKGNVMKRLEKILLNFLYKRGYKTDGADGMDGFKKETNKVSYRFQKGIRGGMIYCPDHITVFINDNPIIINEDENFEEIFSYLEDSFSRYEN